MPTVVQPGPISEAGRLQTSCVLLERCCPLIVMLESAPKNAFLLIIYIDLTIVERGVKCTAWNEVWSVDRAYLQSNKPN